MKIEIARSVLVPALGAVSGVVERRQTLPILGNLLLSASGRELVIRATDLELEIETRIDLEGMEEGEVTVPARKFVDICRALPEGASIKVRTDGDRALVSSGRSRFTLSTLPAADFPSIGFAEGDVSMTLSSAVVKRLFEKTGFAMAQQDVRYYLNGVLLELSSGRVAAVATDGHRLAKLIEAVDSMNQVGDEPRQYIVPAKSVVEIKRLMPTQDEDVVMELTDRTVRLAIGETVIVSKLVDGRYPEYERVIPSDLPRRAVIQKEALRGALNRAAILSNEKYKGVRVTFGAGALGLQTHNPEQEQADDEIEMDYEGDSIVIGFNVAYIADVLQVVEQTQVEVMFRDADSSAIWRGLDVTDETFVIMPMRL